MRRCRSTSAIVILSGLATLECGGPAPSANGTRGSSRVASVAVPSSSAQALQQAEVALFPPGAERDQILKHCASCHPVACAVIGQRSAERWDRLRDAHRGQVDADIERIFAYLKSHFGESAAEPKVDAALLEGGCTPF